MDFGNLDESSPYLGYWPSRGPSQFPGASSPTNGAAPNPNSTLAMDSEVDNASFAESHRADTSPLFNPLYHAHSEASAAPAAPAASLGLSPNLNAPTTWDWQQSPAMDSSRGVAQSSPLGQDVAVKSEDGPISTNEPLSIEDDDAQDPAPADPAPPVNVYQLDPEDTDSVSRDSASQQLFAEEPKAYERAVAQENAPASDEREDATNHNTTPGKGAIDDEPEAATEPAGPESTPPKPAEPAAADLDMDSGEAGDELPSPTPREAPLPQPDEMVLVIEETAVEMVAPSSPDRLIVDDVSIQASSSAKRRRRSANDLLNAAAEAFVQKDYGRNRKRHASVPAPKPLDPPTTVTKRGRKSMPAKISAETTAETPRKRGRPRKSEAAATPVTAPKSGVKRGRPRLSNATPAKKAEIAKPATSARSQRTMNVINKLAKTPKRTPSKALKEPVKSAAPRSVGRPRKTPLKASITATPAEGTPRRGRPPKIAAPSSPAKPVPTPRSSRSTRASNATSPKKTGRVIQPRVVPSPAKRGRVSRTAAPAPKQPAASEPATKKRGRAAAKADVDTAPTDAPKRRGRPPKNPPPVQAVHVEEPASKPATKKRGRGAIVKEETLVEAPVLAKKRGRAAQSVAEEITVAPAAKKRGIAVRSQAEDAKTDGPEPAAKRQRTTRQIEEESKQAELPAPTRGRGRKGAAAPTIQEEVAAPRGRGRKAAAAKFIEAPAEEVVVGPKGRGRGRKAAADTVEVPVEEVSEKPKGRGRGRPATAKPEIIVKAVEEPAKPKARGRGRQAATQVAEEPAPEEPAKPKGRGRGRQAAKAEEPVPEPEPVAEEPKPSRRGRATKSGKGELPSSKTVTKEEPKRRGRAAAGSLAKAAIPKGVAKKGKAAMKKAQPVATRSLRSRG